MTHIAWAVRLHQWYPFGCAIAAFAVVMAAGLEMPVDRSSLLGSAVEFGAIVSGFVGASLALLMGLRTPLMRNIKGTAYVGQLRAYIAQGMLSGVLLAAVSLFGLYFVGLCDGLWFAGVWSGSFVFCVGSLFRLMVVAVRLFGRADN